MVGYTIVYIGAKWCSICKVLGPSIEVLAECYNIDLQVLDYDNDLTDENRETITKVPTVRVIDNNSAILAEWNTNQVNNLKEWLKANVKLS